MATATTYGVTVTRSDLALAGIACAAVPGMQPVSVREVRRGGDPSGEPPTHQTAIVEDSTGRTWVVRVPLSAVAGAELERNEALVSQLGKHLPFKVPSAAGFASLAPHEGRAAVYPYVEGSALNIHRIPSGAGLASAVGRAIAAVHNIPTYVFEEYAVPVFDAESHRARRTAELDRAAATGLVPTGLLARWEQAFEADRLWDFAATCVHGSLDGWAFLVAFADDDAASGRVVALTHWDIAAVTDPAQDFAVLVDQLPPPALDSVLESYSLARSTRPDPYLISRARLAAEMRLINGLAQAATTGDEPLVQNRVDELRKLDRLTAADTSLVPAPRPEPVTTTPVPSDAEGAPKAQSTDASGVSSEADAVITDAVDIDAVDMDAVQVEQGDSEFVEVHRGDSDQEHVDTDSSGEGVTGSMANADTDLEVDPRTTGEATQVEAEDVSFQDDTETIPAVRLGTELDESTRLHDLYDIPEDVDSGGPTADSDR